MQGRAVVWEITRCWPSNTPLGETISPQTGGVLGGGFPRSEGERKFLPAVGGGFSKNLEY